MQHCEGCTPVCASIGSQRSMIIKSINRHASLMHPTISYTSYSTVYTTPYGISYNRCVTTTVQGPLVIAQKTPNASEENLTPNFPCVLASQKDANRILNSKLNDQHPVSCRSSAARNSVYTIDTSTDLREGEGEKERERYIYIHIYIYLPGVVQVTGPRTAPR